MLKPIGNDPNRFKAFESLKGKLPKETEEKMKKADLKEMRKSEETRAACYVPVEPSDPGEPEPNDYPPPN